MGDNAEAEAQCRVLHAIVGHKLPGYFTNAVGSVLAMTRDDDVIIVDNASGLPELTRTFQSLAAADPRVSLLLRDTNDVSRNRKVGGLYDAYNEVVAYALEQGYDYLHIIQNDMQMLWWDDSVMRSAREIYAEYPECVNICTSGMQRYDVLAGNIEYVKPKLARLLDYGLTDTGFYDLGKWRKLAMRFLQSEREHSRKYLDEGLSVFFHPLPAMAFIPWPAVVRNGSVVGREVRSVESFLLRPLTPDEVAYVKESTEATYLEDIAIPWGWTCLTPYWLTDLRTIDQWVYWYRDMRARGPIAAWPRWERRGLSAGGSLRRVQRRPRLGLLPVVWQPAWHATIRALRNRVSG